MSCISISILLFFRQTLAYTWWTSPCAHPFQIFYQLGLKYVQCWRRIQKFSPRHPVKKNVQDRFSDGDEIYMQPQGKVSSQLFKKRKKLPLICFWFKSFNFLFAVNVIRWQKLDNYSSPTCFCLWLGYSSHNTILLNCFRMQQVWSSFTGGWLPKQAQHRCQKPTSQWRKVNTIIHYFLMLLC